MQDKDDLGPNYHLLKLTRLQGSGPATGLRVWSTDCPEHRRPVLLSECDHCPMGWVLTPAVGQQGVACCGGRSVPAGLNGSSATVVGDVMSRRPLSVRADLPIERLILLLVDENISAVPVVDDAHRPVGMASKSDLVFDDYEWAELRDEALSMPRITTATTEQDQYLTELLQSHTVADIMSTDPLTVTQNTPLSELAGLMTERLVHTCPVVDDAGVLVGVVSTLDITAWVARG